MSYHTYTFDRICFGRLAITCGLAFARTIRFPREQLEMLIGRPPAVTAP